MSLIFHTPVSEITTLLRMIPRAVAPLLCTAGLLVAGQVGAANFRTSVVQGVGQNWNAAIWVPEAGGAATAPTAGNTYTVVSNGTTIKNLSANARVRNPTAAGVPTFPGDALIITTNAELRMKVGPSAVNFPGVGGRGGLIMDGGVINLADNAVYTITGVVEVASALLLNAVNDHGGGLQPTRGLNLQAKLIGSGSFIIFQSSTNTPHRIASDENTFSGKWLVTSGRLLGAGNNSLGTNDITIDPLAPLGLDPELVIVAGPAVLELGYDINSAGTLTLLNGGMMNLHQNGTFAAVNIEGTMLAAGTHFYTELAANYPNTLLPGGSGSLTVQPYGTPPVLAPQVAIQPIPQALYAGGTARFSISASGAQPLSYQWRVRQDGAFVDVQDGGGISGAATSSLTISNITAAHEGDYVAVVSNSVGSTTSQVAGLTVPNPTGAAYESAVLAAKPVAYYQLNETGDPATNAPAFDYVGGFTGIYGTSVHNGNPSYNVAGPVPGEGFPGFPAGNDGAEFFNLAGTPEPANSRITLPPWNLNTNTVTMTAWIYPNGFQEAREGVVFTRAANTIAGLYYSGTPNQNGNYTLGYNWNDEGPTFNWNSGLEVAPNQWSFVALVVTSANATIYVINTNSLRTAVNAYPHVVEPFDGPALIGNDPLNPNLRAFNGRIDEVAVFNRSLAENEVLGLYGAASGEVNFAPAISVQPASQTVFAGQTARLTVLADGNPAPTYQWRVRSNGSFVDLADGGNISGATTATLTISNVTAANGADYQVVVTNPHGSATSDVVTITVEPAGPAQHITMSVLQPLNTDWDTPDYWNDGRPASVSAAANPGSTYEILPGGRMRSPNNALDATFPGDLLTVSGNGVFANNPGAGNNIGEIRFKQAAPTGTVRFKKLVMNGGQLDATNPNILILSGEVEIRANTPIYNDTAADRGCQIDAWLTGTGSIEYHAYNLTAFMPDYIYNLNITGTSNTFSGTWNVALGVLLGSGLNSLGTNNITVGANGALETTYDINNPRGSLVLDGRMYLHQNNRFRGVTVGGVALAPGTYTFAQLSAAYPANFPSSWTRQSGSSISTGSGSITVLGDAPSEVRLNFQVLSGDLELSWAEGQLQEAPKVDGTWSALQVSSPFRVDPAGPAKFYRVIVE